MHRSFLIAVLIVLAWAPIHLFGQIKWHSDYGGYTIKSGNSRYSFRNDGSSQNYHRFGSIGLYSDSAGTTGTSIYGPSGRQDNYQNYQRGWSGSGYTPYRNPSTTTYRRYSTIPYTSPESLEATRAFEGYRFERTTSSVTGDASGNPRLNGAYDPRESTAKRISRLGIALDWQNMSHSALLDAESRISTAQRIARYDVRVDWQSSTTSQLLDIESRVSTSKRISRFGESVDWQMHSLSQLLDMESRISSSARLARKGINVNWKSHTLSALLAMESGR